MKAVLLLAADLANAVFAVLAASYITNTEMVWWHLGIAVVFAVCPDIDALPELYTRGRVGASATHPYDHRQGLHFPLLFIVAGILFISMNPYWGWMFVVATTLHFVNDLYGNGWGVPIFWPLSKTRYKFFYRKANQSKANLQLHNLWDSAPAADTQFRVIVTWTKEELPEYIVRYGVDNWQDAYDKNVDRIALLEYSIVLVAIIALVLFW